MDSNTLGFTSYWRNSLADAESGKGTFSRKDTDSFMRWMNITSGQLDDEAIRAFFDGEGESVKTVEVVLRPQVWNRIVKHGKEQMAGAPAIITPLVTSAFLNREGFLFPVVSATIPRDLLEPLPAGHFSIGELVQYDKYKTTHITTTINGDEP
ncbi:TPA: DNA helicase, partial [Escherichia coli]